MIHLDNKTMHWNEGGDVNKDLLSELKNCRLELKETKEQLARLKHDYDESQQTLESQDKQIKAQSRRQRDIERVHKELIEEYEKQVTSMKEEIKRMKHSQEKLLRKFKAINTKVADENSSKLLDAIGSLEKLIRSNEINRSIRFTERDDIDEILQNYLHLFEEEVQQMVTKEHPSENDMRTLDEKLKNRLETMHRFANDLEQIQQTLKSRNNFVTEEPKANSQISIPAPVDEKHVKEDHSHGNDVRETSWYVQVPSINWNEFVNADIPFKENIIEDRIINEFHEKVNQHLQKLETVINEHFKQKLS